MTVPNSDGLRERLATTRFPRASSYDPHWLIDNWMGPHVLWLAEWLAERLDLRPGMRVLDLGCGRRRQLDFSDQGIRRIRLGRGSMDQAEPKYREN